MGPPTVLELNLRGISPRKASQSHYSSYGKIIMLTVDHPLVFAREITSFLDWFSRGRPGSNLFDRVKNTSQDRGLYCNSRSSNQVYISICIFQFPYLNVGVV